MSLALLFHYLMLNIFRMLIHLSSGACDLFVELFHGLYCSGRCVLVLRCGLAGVVWYPDAKTLVFHLIQQNTFHYLALVTTITKPLSKKVK